MVYHMQIYCKNQFLPDIWMLDPENSKSFQVRIHKDNLNLVYTQQSKRIFKDIQTNALKKTYDFYSKLILLSIYVSCYQIATNEH